MYSKFTSLSKEKQDKVINAALKVFSNAIYKNASTDEIVLEAGISKGSLFHYFKSKKDLYLYIYDYAVNIFMKEFYDKIDLNERDIFKRLSNIIIVKLELVRKHPDLFNFILNAMYDETSNLKDELDKRKDQLLMQTYSKVFSNLDTSNFRSDIDPNKAIEMILYTMEGYGNKEALVAKKVGYSEEVFNRWQNDINEYVKIMRKLYYKGE